MNIRLLLLACGLAAATACATADCARKAQSLDCPDGSQAYGRPAADSGPGEDLWFAIADLSGWDLGETYETAGACEMACVPTFLGELDFLTTCDQFTPCGGDLLGDWRWQTGCPYDHPNTEFTGCASGNQANLWEIDGTLTFAFDGTWILNSSRTLYDKVIINPPECSQALDSCDSMAVGTCEGAPQTGCTCLVETVGEAQSTGGTWSVEGTTLTMTDALGITTSSEICAADGRLVMDTEVDGTQRREFLIRWNN